jgi:3-deoxy-D-manno-octulosonic-acid transferase
MPSTPIRWITWYHLVVTTLVILGLPWILCWIALSRKHRKTFLYRSGLILPDMGNRARYAPGRRKPIWIHALSVGEVWSAVPFARQVKKEFPERPVVFSASTQTGLELAREHLTETMDMVFCFPYDLKWVVRRVVSHVDPCLTVLVETDIWPGFLNEMNGRNIPVFWANARLSPQSFAGYRRLRSLSGSLLAVFTGIFVQTRADLLRFRELGVKDHRLVLTGNFKFDQTIPPNPEMTDSLQRIPATGPNDLVLIAGSTHPGEEEILISAFREIRNAVPNLRLILVPRDPERSGEVYGLARRSGWSVQLYSQLPSRSAGAPDLLIIDRIGLLRSLYASADIAVIGGSLRDYGGHNPLEPAVFAKPILFGPHMRDFKERAEILVENRAAVRLTDPSELAQAAADLLKHPDLAREMGWRARQVMRDHRGAIRQTIDHMRNFV